MRAIPLTLSLYLARRYFYTFMALLGGLLALIYLLDLVELLRRAGKQEGVPLDIVLKMGLFKLPEAGQVILPFVILFSAMFTFWTLTRQYELPVIRAAGFSVWQFVLPIIAMAILFGIIHVTLVNPLGAFLLERFERYETKYLGSERNLVTVFQDGFWIRERETKAGEVILNAEKINLNNWQFEKAMGLAFNQEGRLTSRLDAASVRLEDGFWVFENAHITQTGAEDVMRDLYRLPTTLTPRDIEESFANPETVAFWNIPSFIKTLEATGFDSTSLRIQFHYLLSLPLLFMAMILLAAAVSFQSPRSGYAFSLILLGIALGILIFFLSTYLRALGASGQMPAALSAWAPALISFLFGISSMMIFEDG